MTGYKIPFFGIQRQYKNLREELMHATDGVYTSGNVLDGPYTDRFEKSMARRCQRQYAVAVNSGTQALIFAQQALDIQGRVMIPAVSFVATLNSVISCNNEPVFCDIDERGLMDLETIDYALDGNVNAVMYVNLLGNILDYHKLVNIAKFFNQDVRIIEDAAQSFGATYNNIPSGKLGDISVLSFDPTKNLNNYGSGGMLLTDDYDAYQMCLNLRDNGKILRHDYAGTNSKMSEADCAQMLVKLNYFDAWQQRRKEIAEYYTNTLMNYIDVVLPGEGVEHAWQKFVVLVTNRDSLRGYLSTKGIETRIHYDTALFEHPVGWNYINYAKDLMRGASAWAKESLSLPIYPELTDSEIEYVVENITDYLR